MNEALRLGLGMKGKPAPGERFEVRPHAFGFEPGVDLDRMTIIHSYNRDSPIHQRARTWWETIMNDSVPVALAWAVMLAPIRH